MSSTRTLAERFRSQRTDRTRIAGNEVLSMVEVLLEPTSALEIIVESHRSDSTPVVAVRSYNSRARVVAEDGISPTEDAVELVELYAAKAKRLEVIGSDDAATPLQLWHCWHTAGTLHAWTGNSGIIVEDLEPPEGANVRFRMWCSDGLGDPTFDDLVIVVTLGDRI